MISSNIRCFIPVVPLVLVLANAGRADNVVVPGERVGAVRLGATIAQVHQLLGQPTKSAKWKSGETQDSFLGTKPPVDEYGVEKSPRRNLTVIYRAGKVVQIEFNSPAFRTSKGISVTSSLRDFRRTYGPLKPYAYGMDLDEGGYVAYYYDSAANGIASSFGTQDYFDATIKPEEVRIHKRGTKVLPDPGGKPQAAKDEVPVGTLNKGAG
ncbi:hypothetical protein IAD21_05724 [Abditibacteriota bacterium]|nr:hypothetical protein IAD21_05724 [Abditibacteriota bacterium]